MKRRPVACTRTTPIAMNRNEPVTLILTDPVILLSGSRVDKITSANAELPPRISACPKFTPHLSVRYQSTPEHITRFKYVFTYQPS